MQQVKAVERHTTTAATWGDHSAAIAAFTLHPPVGSTALAARLLQGYIAQIPEVAAVFKN